MKVEGRRSLKSSTAGIAVLLLLVTFTFLAVVPVAAQEPVEVRVNATEYVEETFTVTIDVDNVTDFNSGQFDLSFDSRVVGVTDVADGSLDGTAVPVSMWDFVGSETIRVLLKLPWDEGVSGSGYLAEISFEVVGEQGDRSLLDISKGLLGDKNAEAIPAEWFDDEVIVGPPVFDTGIPVNPYPSIFGVHNGTLVLTHPIRVERMYTYPCTGTGGHSEHIKIWNATGWNVSATWNGYKGDWHNISFDVPFSLQAGIEYNYTIKTGSYPQIHHTDRLEVDDGVITCTRFTDGNGKVYSDRIPAIRLE